MHFTRGFGWKSKGNGMKDKSISITSAVIKELMQSEGLTEAELSRRTNLPQTTLHRILTGETSSPRGKSLQAIANYFSLSINELLTSPTPASAKNKQYKIRILDWSKGCLGNIESAITAKTVITDADVSQASFALHMNDSSMDMQFPQGSLLIFDPQRKPNDRCFVLAYTDKEETYFFRQLVCSGSERYLKSLSPDLASVPLRKLEKKDKILGVLVQTKIEY